MEELNYIDMPDEFCQLLRVDMSTTSKYHIDLQSYILKHPALSGIVNRLLNMGEEVDVHSHMKKLGWHGIRDRVLSYYINHSLKRIHIKSYDYDIIEEILNFEQDFRFSTVSGFSRLVLFAFYMKLDCIERNIASIKNHPLYPSEVMIDFLKSSQEKIISIDYAIILLHHLLSYFGQDQLEAMMKQNFSYESLYMNLNEDQKETLCKNYLAYCASINESDIFTTVVV